MEGTRGCGENVCREAFCYTSLGKSLSSLVIISQQHQWTVLHELWATKIHHKPNICSPPWCSRFKVENKVNIDSDKVIVVMTRKKRHCSIKATWKLMFTLNLQKAGISKLNTLSMDDKENVHVYYNNCFLYHFYLTSWLSSTIFPQRNRKMKEKKLTPALSTFLARLQKREQ